MSSRKLPVCDDCQRPIRHSHHEWALRDPATNQLIGRYHGVCQHSASKYFGPGVVVLLTYYHPDRCGPNQERCDAGAFEEVA